MKQFFIPFVSALLLLILHTAFISSELIVPFIWTIVIIYLHGKEHTYLAINSYVLLFTLLLAERMSFGSISFNSEVAYSSLMMLVTFLFVFIYQELMGKRYKLQVVMVSILSLLLYVLPFGYLIYVFTFDITITKDIIFAVSQTNTEESLEFIQESISLWWMFIILALLILVGYLLLKQEKKESRKIEKSLLFLMLIFSYSSVQSIKKDIHLYYFARDSAKEYKKELALFIEMQEKRKVGDIQFNATKVEEDETYIVIIGESLNKNHMSLYGYKRDTTPLLEKSFSTGELLKYTNVYSNHTHTMQVLSLALTEADQLNHKSYYTSLSLIDILGRANVETYWITNQNMMGTWDNLVSILAHQADYLIPLNRSSGMTTKTQKFDEVVLPEIKTAMQQHNKKTKVIFVHLMGSHAHYPSRYPERFKKFSERGVGGYDNSVLYNDYVVNSILELLKEGKGVRGLIYMSDHADDVDAGLGHISSKFTYEMTQIPLITWFSKSYINRYGDSYKNLKSHQETLFSNDFFYDTVLGIVNVKSDHYNKSHDLSSSLYTFLPQNAYTLHGKKVYSSTENPFYNP